MIRVMNLMKGLEREGGLAVSDLATYRPGHVNTVGSPGPHARVLFREGLYIELDEFAQEYQDREHGGVLLGIRRRPEGSQYDEILVNGFIPFPQRYHVKRLRLGPAEIGEIMVRKDTYYPDLQIVGWFHTHPGFGIFLSQSDRQQHAQYFPEPWHLALVIDPQNMSRGLYQLEDAQPQTLTGYYLADLPPAKAVLRRKDGSKAGRRRRIHYPRFIAAVAILMLLLTGVGYGGWLLWDYWYFADSPVSTEQTEGGDDRSAPPSAQELARPVPSTEAQNASAPSASGQQQSGQTDNTGSDESPSSGTTVTAFTPTGEPRANEYVVKAGDNLWDIARLELGDGSRYRDIAELNDLSTDVVLRVGMILQLPEAQE